MGERLAPQAGEARTVGRDTETLCDARDGDEFVLLLVGEVAGRELSDGVAPDVVVDEGGVGDVEEVQPLVLPRLAKQGDFVGVAAAAVSERRLAGGGLDILLVYLALP